MVRREWTRRRFVAGSAVGMAAVLGLGLGLGAATRRAEAASADVLVVGGGVGGVAAALAALRLGKTVILTEETDWIGGQLTAQAVPPDENPWIEATGCTRSYREFRNGVRQYYKSNYALRKGPYGYQYFTANFINIGPSTSQRITLPQAEFGSVSMKTAVIPARAMSALSATRLRSR